MKGLKPFLSLAVGFLACVMMMGCAGSIPQNGAPALNIAHFTVSEGVIGISYRFLLVASGGVQPYTWTIIRRPVASRLEHEFRWRHQRYPHHDWASSALRLR